MSNATLPGESEAVSRANRRPVSLPDSYRHCEQLAKRAARNFYYSFVTLPPDKKAAMCAVYAFMRYSDDLSDDAIADVSNAIAIEQWREALRRAFLGDYGDSQILPAFHDTVKRYCIPSHYFEELIDGTASDLTKTRYASFDELHQYCYQVAGVVGFVCLHVWGFDKSDGKALEYAEACGLAFQLTNILRDVREDAERDRIYLPQTDLTSFGVTEQHLKSGVMTERVRDLLKFEADRARQYYEQAAALAPLVSTTGRSTLIIMMRIYRGILDAIVKSNYDVFTTRARVPTARKVMIVAGTWLRFKAGSHG